MKKTAVKNSYTSLKNIQALNTHQLKQIKGGNVGIIIEEDYAGLTSLNSIIIIEECTI